MTCREVVSRLDDLADGELSATETARLNQHLNQCPDCREFYEQTMHLKEILRNASCPLPGQDYWNQTTAKIMARTTDAEPRDPEVLSFARKQKQDRNALFRAILSVAASITILFLAIYVGSTQQQQLAEIGNSNNRAIATADVWNVTGTDNTPVFTELDRQRLTRGLMLMGSPGVLGRFSRLPDLLPDVDVY